MGEINLILPLVPTLNHCYRNLKVNLRILMPKGIAWKNEVQLIALEEKAKQKWMLSKEEKLVMELRFYWKDRRRRDCDNALKLLQDTLEGILYENDHWVLPRIMDWNIDRDNPRVEVKLWTLASETHGK